MMEDYSKLFSSCLAMIREKYGEKYRHWFDVWFGDVRFENYDPESHTLLVQVPSKYVYEYLEMNGAKDICWAAQETFRTNVVLQYRIIATEPSFADVATYLQQHSAYDSRKNPCNIRIDNARKRLEDGLRYFLGEQYLWLPGYDKIADWLTDNRGRGLLCVGSPGRGKSLLVQKILPVILGNGGRPIPIVNARELHGRLDELKRERILIIDNLGKEERMRFGNPDRSFFELCDNAEQTGNLLIVATDLSTTAMSPEHPSAHYYTDNIEHRYGTEVLDRLKAITTMTRLEGPSFRE